MPDNAEFSRLVKLLQEQPAKGAQLILELREEVKLSHMFIAAIAESQPTKKLYVHDVAVRSISRSDELVKQRDDLHCLTIVTVKKA